MSLLTSNIKSFVSGLGPTLTNNFGQRILRLLSVTQALLPTCWPPSTTLYDNQQFNFIVVGSGSAGAIVANRLSEMSNWTILLVEAGGNPPAFSALPVMGMSLLNSEYDWNYKAKCGNNVGKAHSDGMMPLPRGKILGGTSFLNYMVYSRGVPIDYNNWDSIVQDWNWDSLLYYFKKSERMEDETLFEDPRTAPYHSADGEVRITRASPNRYYQRILERLTNAYGEIGIPNITELNGPDPVGVTLPHYTFADGRRSSTAEAFLLPIKNRTNLKIAKFTRATKILIDPENKQAIGIKIQLKDGKYIKVYANKEVIVCAGAIDSPKLLMLSGIGPTEELSKFGIETIVDLPVGKNLQDHPAVPLLVTGRRGLHTAAQNLLTVTELDEMPLALLVGFFKLNESNNESNQDEGIQPTHQFISISLGTGLSPIIHYVCRTFLNYDSTFCSSFARPNRNREYALTFIALQHPYSRGTVTLNSSNPLDDPIIDLNYYDDDRDLEAHTAGVRYMAQLAKTSYFKSVGGRVEKLLVNACEGLEFDTEEYWLCYSHNTVTTFFHVSGTCSMGDDGVVDDHLRVHGISGLRVVDASVIPLIPTANTNAPTMMIAEKASDLIKSDHFPEEIN